MKAKSMEDEYEDKILYLVVDSAAAGGIVQDLVVVTKMRKAYIFAPESFEYLLLNTSDFRRYLPDELEHTENYANEGYLSWKRYYTDLLETLYQKYLNKVRYNKGHINSWFLRSDFLKKISSQLEDLNIAVKKL